MLQGAMPTSPGSWAREKLSLSIQVSACPTAPPGSPLPNFPFPPRLVSPKVTWGKVPGTDFRPD